MSPKINQNVNTQKLRQWLPLGILILLFGVFTFTGTYKLLSFEALIENYANLDRYIAENFWPAVLVYTAIYIVAVAMSFPAAWVLTIAGGIFFGWWIAGILTIFAATLGASVTFWIASTSLGEQLRLNAGGFIKKMRDGMQENAVSYMLFLRLVPAFPFALINIAPAVLGVPFTVFFWTTLVGIAPGTFAYAYAGEGLASLAAAQSVAYIECQASAATNCGVSLMPSDLVTPELLIAFSALGLVSLLPIVIKRKKSKNAA